MPHIVIEGPVDFKAFLAVYEPCDFQSVGEVLRLQNSYISKAEDAVLIEAIAVEQGPANRFLVQAVRKEGKLTVKCYPGTDPEKTPGVKKILAIVAKKIKDLDPQIAYGSSNLQEFLL
ncbi:MAG: hypothetical protein GY868_15135 [Deltaproteobacteria bacterium]|nr:hypothetical protein [Deltaproteobacteria bacterium]